MAASGPHKDTSTIMHVVRPALGGMRTHIEALVRHLGAGRWRQLVVGPVDDEWRRRLEQLGVSRVVPLAIADRLEPFADLAAARFLRRLRRELQPAIIHCHGAKAALVGRLTHDTTPVVYTVHGELSPSGGSVSNAARRAAERFLARTTQKFIAVSSAIAGEIESSWGVAPERVAVMHNGVDAGVFRLPAARRSEARLEVRSQLGIPVDSLVVGSVARLAPEKGLDTLLEAAAALTPADRTGNGEPVMVVIAGEGPERDRLEAQARALGIWDRLRLPGHVTDIPAFLATFDVFALPSKREGQSIALLEAMAAGLPVVASRVGGIPEVVSSGVDGILVAPGSPLELRRGLFRALGPEGEQLGKEARRRVAKDFTWQSVAERLEKLYEELLR